MIKPCQCNGRAELIETLNENNEPGYYRVSCVSCFISTPDFLATNDSQKAKQQAIDAWNKRPREEGILDDIKKRDTELFKDLKDWTIKLEGMFLSNTAIRTIKETIKKYEVK